MPQVENQQPKGTVLDCSWPAGGEQLDASTRQAMQSRQPNTNKHEPAQKTITKHEEFVNVCTKA